MDPPLPGGRDRSHRRGAGGAARPPSVASPQRASRRAKPGSGGRSHEVRGASMSFRNRELLNLLVVGALTGVGFASVYIARQSVVSTGSVAYALIFLGLYLVAHAIVRATVPYADPYLLPLT